MKLSIFTQYRENYGAHDWDGVGACPQYWKNKGGEVYIVENLTDRQIARLREQGIPTLERLLNVKNDYFEEYVSTWDVMDDDAVVCEDWETPTVLAYESGRWVARIYIDGELNNERAL